MRAIRPDDRLLDDLAAVSEGAADNAVITLAKVLPVTAAASSDADLISAHAAGDPYAFSELVKRHRDRMWAVALRTLRDPE